MAVTKYHSAVVTALTLTAMSGCAKTEGSASGEQACSLAPTASYDGKEYISVRGPGVASDDKRRGKRLGTGRTIACRTKGDPVAVFRVRGLAVGQAVYTERFGLMERWNEDGSTE